MRLENKLDSSQTETADLMEEQDLMNEVINELKKNEDSLLERMRRSRKANRA